MATLEIACTETTKDGKPCRGGRIQDDGKCWLHSPKTAPNHHENGLKGARKSAIIRRKQALSVRQRLAERLEQHVDEIYDAYRTAWLDGDYKAGSEAINQAHGKPLQPVQQAGKTFVIVHPLISAPKTFQVDGDNVIELPAGDIREE